MTRSNSEIITVTDLKSFFYESLTHVNKRSLCPIPEETIYYSSSVLEKYSLSSEFFENKEGRIRNKILGFDFLKASLDSKDEQVKAYKDIGDTALVLSGFFSESTKRSLVDEKYYIKIGQLAYKKMHDLERTFFDIPHFYKMMSSCFENVSLVIKHFSMENKNNYLESLLVSSNDTELLVGGIHPPEKKVS